MSLNAKTNSVLTFIKARNPRRLRVLIFNIESSDGKIYDWDIHFAQGYWFAYYRRSLGSAEETLKEMVD